MNELDLDALADWLDDDARPEECLDIHGLHGYLTALAVCGEPLSDDWLAEALAMPLDQLPQDEARWFAASCVELYKTIGDELYADDQVSLTFEPTVDWQDSPMQYWCEAFMEVVFSLPDHFSHSLEDNLATLLLPIEVASGLFADEPDFQGFYRNPRLLEEMFDQIPELLTDLYLLLQSPE